MRFGDFQRLLGQPIKTFLTWKGGNIALDTGDSQVRWLPKKHFPVQQSIAAFGVPLSRKIENFTDTVELTESCCHLRPPQTLTHQGRSYSKLTASLQRFSMAASAEAGLTACRGRSSGDSLHRLTFDHLQFVAFMLGVCSTVHTGSVPRCGHQAEAVVRPLNGAVEKQAE